MTLYFVWEHSQAKAPSPTAVSQGVPSVTEPAAFSNTVPTVPMPTPVPVPPSATPAIPALHWDAPPDQPFAFETEVIIPFTVENPPPEPLSFHLLGKDCQTPLEPPGMFTPENGVLRLPAQRYSGRFCIRDADGIGEPLFIDIAPPNISISNTLTISPDIRLDGKYIIPPQGITTTVTLDYEGTWQWKMAQPSLEVLPGDLRTARILPSSMLTATQMALTIVFSDVTTSSGNALTHSVSIPLVPYAPLPKEAQGWSLYAYNLFGSSSPTPQPDAEHSAIHLLTKCAAQVWVLDPGGEGADRYRVMALGWVKPVSGVELKNDTDNLIVFYKGDETFDPQSVEDAFSPQAWYTEPGSRDCVDLNGGFVKGEPVGLVFPPNKDGFQRVLLFGIAAPQPLSP